MAWAWVGVELGLLRLIQPQVCLLVAVEEVRPVGCPEARPVGCPVGCPELAAARYPEWAAAEQVAVVPLPHHLCRREYR